MKKDATKEDREENASNIAVYAWTLAAQQLYLKFEPELEFAANKSFRLLGANFLLCQKAKQQLTMREDKSRALVPYSPRN